MLFDQWEREVITHYYKDPSKWGKLNKPLVVSQFETTKAIREFKREMKAEFKPVYISLDKLTESGTNSL